MFRRITSPLLKPIDIPYLLTDGRGAPGGSILTNNMLMYMKFSSSRGHIGSAASVGVLVFIMTTVIALGIFYFLGDRDKRES